MASYEYAWKEGLDALTKNDVLVIDEAGMIGTKLAGVYYFFRPANLIVAGHQATGANA